MRKFDMAELAEMAQTSNARSSIIATYPAYTILDLNVEIIEVSRPAARAVDFATAFQSRNHGIMYHMHYISGVAAYAAEYNDDEAAAVARAVERGDPLFWMTRKGVSITHHDRGHELKVLLREGQKIRFDGQLLDVVKLHGDHFDLKAL
ncbi:TPA: hypothetical protein ACHSMM_004507 [Yersinia enterocolitica]